METPQVQVLLVEDDVVEQRAVERAFRQRNLTNPIRIVNDGLEALQVLRGEGGHEPLAKPYLILLDLNMPRMDGIEFLRALRSDAEHRSAIVFVLTTSREEKDRTEAYALNVAGYVVKSDFGVDFVQVIDMIEHYWRVVEFPQ